MKICLVSQEYPPDTARGGIGTQTWNKARALSRLGHTVHVLSCAARPGPDPQVTAHDGVTVYRMQPPGCEFPVYTTPVYWLGYAWSVLGHLGRLMQAGPYDVVDFAEYGGEGYAYLLDRTPWNWAPVVVQLHGPLALFADRIGWPEKGGDFYRIGTMMEDLCIRRADGLMACSANIADFTAAFHGVPRDTIEVVHCGVDAAGFQCADKLAAENRRPTVLFVGNISASKGVLTVVDAVLRLRAKYPDILLQLLGKPDDDIVKQLQTRTQREGAESNVEFVGFAGRDDLPGYYQRAHVFCSPAHHEPGVANVYIEAMASSCPVVACTTGAAPEAVEDGVAGLLVPPGDAEATAHALDQVLASRDLRRRMGEAGRRRVEAYFAVDRYIERVLNVYRHAVERSRDKKARLLAVDEGG